MGHMTDGLTFRVLRDGNRERAARDFQTCKDWKAADWLMATTGELGELANLLKKVSRGDFVLDTVRKKLGKEISDIIIYLDLLAQHLDIDLGPAVMDKFNEVSRRVNSRVYIDAEDWHLRAKVGGTNNA